LPDQQASIRVGIIANKKVGKAVTRNLVRRRLREAFISLVNENPIEQQAKFKQNASFSLIIIVRPDAAEADFWELKRSLKKALRQGKLIR